MNPCPLLIFLQLPEQQSKSNEHDCPEDKQFEFIVVVVSDPIVVVELVLVDVVFVVGIVVVVS